MIASYLESCCNHDPERRQSNLQLFGSVLHRYASMLQRCCNSTLQHPFATIGIVGIDLQVNWDIFAKRLSNVGKSLSRGSRFGCIRVARFMKTCKPNIASKVLINMQRRSNSCLFTLQVLRLLSKKCLQLSCKSCWENSHIRVHLHLLITCNLILGYVGIYLQVFRVIKEKVLRSTCKFACSNLQRSWEYKKFWVFFQKHEHSADVFRSCRSQRTWASIRATIADARRRLCGIMWIHLNSFGSIEKGTMRAGTPLPPVIGRI